MDQDGEFYKNYVTGSTLTVTKECLVLKLDYMFYKSLGTNTIKGTWKGIYNTTFRTWRIDKKYKNDIINKLELKHVTLIQDEPKIKEEEKVTKEKEDDNTEEMEDDNKIDGIIRLLNYKIIILKFFINEENHKKDFEDIVHNYVISSFGINQFKNIRMVKNFDKCLSPTEIIMKNIHSEFRLKKNSINDRLRKYGIDKANEIGIDMAKNIIEGLNIIIKQGIEIDVDAFISSIIEEGAK